MSADLLKLFQDDDTLAPEVRAVFTPTVRVPCPACNGRKVVDMGAWRIACKVCAGRGYILEEVKA
jgi:DnaJ-class molecular chaperone